MEAVMNTNSKWLQRVILAMVALSFLGGSLMMAFAETRYRKVYDARAQQYRYVPENTVGKRLENGVRDGWRNPVVKQSAIGAGVGAATGAITGKGTLKGAGVGAIVGAGSGLIDTSSALRDKPMVRSTLKGAAIGTGAGVVTEGSVGKSAAVGAGVGAGSHLIRDWWNRR
jgi:Glycine-zipper domain